MNCIKNYFVLSLILLFNDYCSCSNPKPILNSKNPSAIPIQNFDFVFIPKEVVKLHMPAFERCSLRLKAERIAQELKISLPIPTDVETQFKLLEWYKRQKWAKQDPNGDKMKSLKRELCKLNSQLDSLISYRRNLISDVARLSLSVKDCDSGHSNQALSDSRFIECKAIKDHYTHQMSELNRMNLNERNILQEIHNIRQQFALF